MPEQYDQAQPARLTSRAGFSFDPPRPGDIRLTRFNRYIYFGYTSITFVQNMKTVISVKVDKDVRDKARTLAKKIGVPLSMVVNRQLKQFTEERRIEFAEPLMPNAKTRKLLDKALRDIREGRDDTFAGPFHTAGEMDRYLDGLKK
jgi:antitoxin component of RelBE/YafQ-DinJ toxin-antitoxin module